MRDDDSEVVPASLTPWILWALILVLGLVLYFTFGTRLRPMASPAVTQESP